MSLQLRKTMTVTEFEAFINELGNTHTRFELIDQEVVEVPSNPLASEIAVLISFFIRLFLRENNIKGHITGEGGGYIINGHVFAPDVAYLSHERQSALHSKGFNPIPPELAVEVISDPSNSAEQTDLRRKLAHYRVAGVVTWVVDHATRHVEVHLPDGSMSVLNETMTLSGGDVLPGFALPVHEIFPANDGDASE